MAENLTIVEESVSTLMQGFNRIRDRLNLDEQITEPSSDNVGCSELVDAVFAFNHQVSDTKNKYKKKTENLRDFLENVKTGSDEADEAIAKAISDAVHQS